MAADAYLFATERGRPMTAMTARHIIKRAGRLAGLPFPVHPHMVRHATGYRLVNNRIGYLIGDAPGQFVVAYPPLASSIRVLQSPAIPES